MATLYIREDELRMAGERLSEVASEMTNPTLSECAAAESLAIPGGNEADLEGTTDAITRLLRNLTSVIAEASNDCYAVADDFEHVDSAFAKAFEVTLGDGR